MRKPTRMLRSEVEAFLNRHPSLPHDAVVYVERSSLVFYDESWDGTRRTPRWYYLNHSANANCKPKIKDTSKPPRDQEIEWVTTRHVAAWEELFFTYEDADPNWV